MLSITINPRCDGPFLGAILEFPRGHAANDRIRARALRHDRASRHDAPFGDRHAVQDADARANPHVILDRDAKIGQALQADIDGSIGEIMVGRNDCAVGGDPNPIANFKSSVAIENGVGVNGAVVPNLYAAAIRKKHRAVMDLAVPPYGDFSTSDTLHFGAKGYGSPFFYSVPAR